MSKHWPPVDGAAAAPPLVSINDVLLEAFHLMPTLHQLGSLHGTLFFDFSEPYDSR